MCQVRRWPRPPPDAPAQTRRGAWRSAAARCLQKLTAAPDRGNQPEVPLSGDSEEVLVLVNRVLSDETLSSRIGPRRRVVRDAERVSSARKQRRPGLTQILLRDQFL